MFEPPSLHSSIVSVASPIAEEESNVSFDHRARFQQSPKPFHGKTDFSSGMFSRKDPVGKSGPLLSYLRDQTMPKIDNFVSGALNFFRGQKQEENLLWFAHLLELRTIQSEFFFEKYFVVGLSDEHLMESIT